MQNEQKTNLKENIFSEQNAKNMTTLNLTFKGYIAYSEDRKITITYFTIGKYHILSYDYLYYKTRLIKYKSIPELFQDFRSRLYHLSLKQDRNIIYTDYGKECIKNWYKITNG